jgi:hypothetical protein
VRIAMWRTLKLVKYNRLVFSAKLFNRWVREMIARRKMVLAQRTPTTDGNLR